MTIIRRSTLLKGIVIEPGIVFKGNEKYAKRISTERATIDLRNMDTGDVNIAVLQLDDGLFRPMDRNRYKASHLSKTSNLRVLKICKYLATTTSFRDSASQIALWLVSSDPQFNRINGLKEQRSGKHIFTANDAARGLYLAEKMGIRIDAKRMANNMQILFASLPDPNTAVAQWGARKLNAKGIEGSDPVDIAEKAFISGSHYSFRFAAMALGKLNRTALLQEYMLDRDNFAGNRSFVLRILLESASQAEGKKLIEKAIESDFKTFFIPASSYVIKWNDSSERNRFAAKYLRLGIGDGSFLSKMWSIRKKLASSIASSKKKNAVGLLLEFLANAPDVEVRIECGKALVKRVEKKALPILDKCAYDPIVVASKSEDVFRRLAAQLRDRLKCKAKPYSPPEKNPSPQPTRSRSLLDRIKEKGNR